ncbi:MAG: peptidylprolyl isomerase [Cytophagaceae bacterium]|jgi:peptidyl-prolyl cis-trans isomerase SurA|nr:peptidylprolyl isomerase [Cytophagaceae bacterium]
MNIVRFLFITWVGIASLQAQVIDRIIAKVDNYILLESELEAAYQQYLSSMEGPPPEDLKCRILETLLINKVLVAKAEIDSVVVDKAQVDGELDRRMQYFIRQIGSQEKLEQYYQKSVEELKQDLRPQVKEQLLTEKMQSLITDKVKVSPGDVKKFYNELPKDSLPFFSTEYEVGQLVKKAMVSKDQKQVARKKLIDIRQRILNGEDFCTLAEQFSEDFGSAKECGDLGYFNMGELVPPYEAAALKLKKPVYDASGNIVEQPQLSEVIESQFGFHIIQLLDRKGNSYRSRHILIKAVSSTKDVGVSATFLDSLRTEILKGSIAFEKAAKEYSDDKETSGNGGFFIDPTTGDSRILTENLEPGIFFTVDTMKVGSITRPMLMKSEDGSEAMRLIYFKSMTPPHQANLKDDYQKIYKAALEEKKNNAVNEWFDKTKTEVFIDIISDYSGCKLLTNQ